MSAFIDAESLRRNAIERLHASAAPPWLLRALEGAAIALRHAVSRWSASEGDFAAHAVTLSVDAEALARIDADPLARELLVSAVCGATSRRPLESVSDVSLRWSGSVVAVSEGYRGAQRVRAPASLEEALRAWLQAVGDAGDAPWSVSVTGAAATLRGARPEGARRAAVERAVMALTDARSVRWERG